MTTVAPSAAHTDDLWTALEPVRRALLEDAEVQANRIVAEATRQGDLSVEEAERHATAEIQRAERRGATSAQVRADQTLAHERNDAHGRILQVEDDLRRRLHHAVRTAALGLADDPRYPDLIATVYGLARNQLGPTMEIERDPGGLGGIVAVHGSRRVDYTLPALAERTLETLAGEVGCGWT